MEMLDTLSDDDYVNVARVSRSLPQVAGPLSTPFLKIPGFGEILAYPSSAGEHAHTHTPTHTNIIHVFGSVWRHLSLILPNPSLLATVWPQNMALRASEEGTRQKKPRIQHETTKPVQQDGTFVPEIIHLSIKWKLKLRNIKRILSNCLV